MLQELAEEGVAPEGDIEGLKVIPDVVANALVVLPVPVMSSSERTMSRSLACPCARMMVWWGYPVAAEEEEGTRSGGLVGVPAVALEVEIWWWME